MSVATATGASMNSDNPKEQEVAALRKRITHQRRELRRLNKQAEQIWHGWRRGTTGYENRKLRGEVDALTQRLRQPPEVREVYRYRSDGVAIGFGVVLCILVIAAWRGLQWLVT